jgi:hypothetical protein
VQKRLLGFGRDIGTEEHIGELVRSFRTDSVTKELTQRGEMCVQQTLKACSFSTCGINDVRGLLSLVRFLPRKKLPQIHKHLRNAKM